MDIKHLEYFVRVAELGSFTRAAAGLRVSQPVLSRHVRQLELELKTHLLYRNGHGVTPTESGKRLMAHGKGILHQVDLARHTAEASIGGINPIAPSRCIGTLRAKVRMLTFISEGEV